MADSSLSVGSNPGAQAPSTQSGLQANGQANLDNGLSGRVQPGITGDQLRSNQGIQLTPTTLPAISLGTATAPKTTTPVKHHFNPALMIFSILLFAVAIVLFRITSESGKKHN